jgi:hypothetical protein
VTGFMPLISHCFNAQTPIRGLLVGLLRLACVCAHCNLNQLPQHVLLWNGTPGVLYVVSEATTTGMHLCSTLRRNLHYVTPNTPLPALHRRTPSTPLWLVPSLEASCSCVPASSLRLGLLSWEGCCW